MYIFRTGLHIWSIKDCIFDLNIKFKSLSKMLPSIVNIYVKWIWPTSE